jgi:hypothetical protein
LQYTDFNLASIAVFGDSTDYLDSNSRVGVSVNGLYDFTESSLSKKANGTI